MTVAALYVQTNGCYFGLPDGPIPDTSPSLVSWCRNKNPHDTRPRVGKAAASRTPPAFRDLLLDMARSAARRAA